MAYSVYSDGLALSRPRSRASGYGVGPGSYPVQTAYSSYHQPAYQIYAPPTVPMSNRLTGPSYEDLDIDAYHPDERRMSSANLSIVSRHRRHSTASYPSRPMESYYLPSSLRIKFKRKRAFMAGISLAEAQDRVRLSSNDAYTVHDLHADRRNRIQVRVSWPGYSSVTYEIPLDGHDSGRVSLQTLARRVSRACVHYLQSNGVPVVWDRVRLHHMEEVAYGLWQLMLTAR